MEIAQLKELLQRSKSQQDQLRNRYRISKLYYQAKTKITERKTPNSSIKDDNPLRQANNAVGSNFHQLLVDQEAGYLATVAPTIDVGSDRDNDTVAEVLGDTFNTTLKRQVVEASNAGVAWLHYWIDDDNNFRYSTVPPDQIYAIFDTKLDNKILGVLRSYKHFDDETGAYVNAYEYWTEKQAEFFKESANDQNVIVPWDRVTSYDASSMLMTGSGNVLTHNFGRVPFIAFPKNDYWQDELHKYKGLIDSYDDVFNGFINDVDDIQQVFLVLKNFGGQDLDSFMQELQNYKAIQVDNLGSGDNSGVDKLQIDIPVEARQTLLQIIRDDIFLYGQGIDPSNFQSSNASGVAIKMLYSHLELKASNTQTQFDHAIRELVRAIMDYKGLADVDGRKIAINWRRTMVEDNLAKAQAVATLANFTSEETIAKNNPLVDDWQDELKAKKDDLQQSDGFKSEQSFKDDESDRVDE